MADYEMTLGGCGPCVCKKCLLWWSGRCPRGGCWDEWRAAHEPWPGPVRRQWSDWDKPGEQAHWCRGGTCYAARSCPDYIEYEADKTIVQDCLEGAVVKYQDGYIQCSMIEVMGCEECYRRFEERIEGVEERVIESNNTNELQGQYELSDLLPKDEGTGMPERYDEEGRLLNVDWPELGGRGTTSSVTADAVPPSHKGEGKDTGEAIQKPSHLVRGAQDYSKAVALLSAPAEQRDALAAQAVEEGLSVRQLQQEIKRLNAEKLKAQMQIDSFIDQTDRLREEIANMDDREQKYDRAIVERDDKLKAAQAAIEREREAATLANAKAAAAEASAEALRKLHSDAENRAAKSAQRASDAVNRANQVAKDLAEARAKIQALSEAAAAASATPPEVQTVEVVPEEVQRELDQLRRDLAEARAMGGTTSSDPAKAGPPSPLGEGKDTGEASAAEKFRWFYQNQMQPTFKTALNLLKEVALEDGKAADAFATAITNACRVLMNQIGTKEE